MLFQQLFTVAAGLGLVTGRVLDNRSVERRSAPGDCVVDIWTGAYYIGGFANPVPHFCESAWPAPDFFKRITTYDDGKSVKGIKFEYFSGKISTYGTDLISNEKVMEFAPGELITQAQLSGNGVGTRLGRIHLVTDKQDVVLGGNHEARWYDMDVGSGLLTGFGVGDGGEIDFLSLFFLAGKIQKIEIGELKLDQDPSLDTSSVKPITLDAVHFYNKDVDNATFQYQGKKSETTETSTSSSTTGSFNMGIEVSVEGDLPFIAKATTTVSAGWSVSHETMSSTKHTEAIDLVWTFNGALKKGEGVVCTAIVQKGEGDFPYSSVVKFYLDNGHTYTYPEKGTLHSVQFSKVDQNCEVNNAETVDGLTEGSVTPVQAAVVPDSSTPAATTDAPSTTTDASTQDQTTSTATTDAATTDAATTDAATTNATTTTNAASTDAASTDAASTDAASTTTDAVTPDQRNTTSS